jgi:hypothetical protein
MTLATRLRSMSRSLAVVSPLSIYLFNTAAHIDQALDALHTLIGGNGSRTG